MTTSERLRCFLIGSAIVIGATAGFGAASGQSLREAGQRFAAAYAAADRVALQPLWSGERSFVHGVETTMRVKCVDAVGAVVTSVDESSGIVGATIVRWESPRQGSAPPQLLVRHLLVTFVPRDGGLAATKVEIAESGLATRLLANPDDAAGTLRANDDLVTRDLAVVLSARAGDFVGRGEVKKAEAAARMLDDVASLLADSDAASLAKSVWASIKGRAGDARAELGYAQEALALAERGRDPDTLLRALYEVGHAYERLPERDDEALKAYDRARLLAGQVEDRSLLGHVYTSATAFHVRHGDSIRTLARAKDAEAVFTEEEDDSGLAIVAQGMAITFVNQGNTVLGRVHALRGLEAAKRARNETLQATFLMLLGYLDVDAGNYDDAMAHVQDSLTIARRLNDRQTIGEALRVSGMAHLLRHEYPAAIRDLEEGIQSHKAAARPRLAAIVMVQLVRAKLESGDARGAIEAANTTAATTRQLGQHAEFVETKEMSGRAHHLLGENDAALADFNEAIEDAEMRRPWIAGDPGAQERAFEEASIPYRHAAALLAELGRLDEAFTMAERGKARVLLDTLRSGRERIDEVMTAEERRRDKEFGSQMALLNRRLTAETAKTPRDAAAVAKLTGDLGTARADYETFLLTLYGAHSRLRQTHGDVRIATRADVARILDAQSAIAVYQVMEDRTFVLLLRRDSIQRFDLKLDRDTLEKRVVDYTSSLAGRDLDYRSRSRALYDLLLRPLESALRDVKVLCIVPDDALWQVPFESLIDRKGKFVVESRACFYAQSVSVLAEATRGTNAQPASLALLAVGNPKISAATETQSKATYRGASLLPLPNAEEEVRALRELYPRSSSRILIGSAANEAVVKSEMSQFRILHFATHAEFNDENPMYAHIVLAQDERAGDDGLLEAWEIMRMNLHADIAILSACETAKGRVAAGEGIIGFSWALFVAGCPSSVVSHWKVNSDSTAKLMVDFHRHLLSGHNAFQRAVALRQAKLDMLRKPKWAHPFYWSAFVLVGRG